jgi:hypothetical protein
MPARAGSQSKHSWAAKQMTCSVCKKPKQSLVRVTSTLLPAVQFFSCPKCLDGGKEPRYIIILTAREQGIDKVTPYIVGRKYEGEEITAAQLLG